MPAGGGWPGVQSPGVCWPGELHHHVLITSLGEDKHHMHIEPFPSKQASMEVVGYTC